MALVRCDGCQERPESRFTSCYIAWTLSDGRRVAYKNRLCAACFVAKVAPLDVDRQPSVDLTCPQCGISTENDFDAVYITAYVRGAGPLRLEAPFCNACAAHYRIWVQQSGNLLEDRSGAAGGTRTEDEPASAWSMLGLRPR